MNNLAIITARSGSKGLKDKNINELCGKQLMAYSIEAALESKCFITVMVSTDSENYAKIAMDYGVEFPFLRSVDTSSDAADSWAVVDEVLRNYYKFGRLFDTVCMLQPTSPLREAQDIVNGYNKLETLGVDAITAVCEAEHSSGVYCYLPSDRSLEEYREKNGYYLPRQKGEKL